MKRLNCLSVFLLIILVILVIAVGSVQAVTLNITVTDRTRDELSGISITIAPENGDVVTGVSDATGAFEVTDLAAGVYTITASSPGYTDKVTPNVRLGAEETISVTITLSAEVIQLDQIAVTASRRREKVLEALASVAFLGQSTHHLKVGACAS